MIEFKNVGTSFDNGKTWAVQNVNLKIKPGETMVLLGSSGAGKSTLLKMINRLITPSTGEIIIDHKNIATIDLIQLRRKIGYVFQNIGLFPHMTATENIAVVLRLMKKSVNQRVKIAHELLELVNMSPDIYKDRYPYELSGGEQQRISVARALSTNPEYILMDEPFGSLDAFTRDGLQQTILKLKKEINKTIVFVTHDIAEALRLGDKIAVLHQGKLEQVDEKHRLIHEPKTIFVKQLFQNFINQIKMVNECIA